MEASPEAQQPDEITPPIACNLTAIPAEQRGAHIRRATSLLFQTHEEQQHLPDGIAWRFKGSQYEEVAAYVANERRCCPFFTFSLEVSPAGGPVWLRVTGDAAMKAYLQSELASQAHLHIQESPC